MSAAGSHDYAAAVAARAGLEAGLTRLGIALVSHVASRGIDFQTDRQIQGEIARPDGRPYHRESIGRKRRELAKRGILSSRRVYPGATMPGARWRSSHGTTIKAVLWAALKLQQPPTARGARRAAARETRRLTQAETPRAPDILTGAELLAAIDQARAGMRGPPE